MSDRLWKFIAYGYFISNTLCLIVLLEMLILGKPYISLFLLILATTIYLNFKIFKIKKRQNFYKSGLPGGQIRSKFPQLVHLEKLRLKTQPLAENPIHRKKVDGNIC